MKGRGMEHLHRDPVSKIIYFRRYTKKTGPKFKSLRTRDPAEAKDKRDEMLASIEPRKKVGRPLALELFDDWVDVKKIEGASDGTLTSIAASRAHLAPFLEIMLPDEITSPWWAKEYIKTVRAKTHAKRKFFNDRKWLSAYLRWLFENGVLTKLPKLVNPDEKSGVGRAFTDDEVTALIHHAQNDDLRLAILMASTMGMRRLEVFALRCDRVDLKNKVIRLRVEDTKIRKGRAFAISDVCWPLIQARCKPGSIWVFPSKFDKRLCLHKDGFKTAWTNLRSSLGIKGRFHDLRHTFLTKAFKAQGANPALICHYAGLSLEVAQSTYLHFDEKDTAAVAELVRYE
jgi:integrase